MDAPSTSSRAASLVGRFALGLVVGASFGIAIGALVASWVYGVGAIEEDAVAASYLAGAITLGGALVGSMLGLRSARSRDSEAVPESTKPSGR